MIEYAHRPSTNGKLDPCWRLLPDRALEEMDFRFDQYQYRIDDITYRIHNREFIVMAERELLWRRLSR